MAPSRWCSTTSAFFSTTSATGARGNERETSLLKDEKIAKAHWNLALLCRGLGRRCEAIQYMAAYRCLTSPAE